ncbi:MAG: hypothetical protein WCI26_08545 [Acidimicrobiales bacterium]
MTTAESEIVDGSDETSKGGRRRYVPRAEGRVVLIDATIELLRNNAFADVTTRKISEAADLNEFAIQRIFGSQLGLFAEVARELSTRFAARFAGLPLDEVQPGALFDPDLVLRTRLLAWLLGSGAEPEELKIDPALSLNQALFRRHWREGAVSEETARVFTQLIIYLAEGYITFESTHDSQPDDIQRLAQLVEKFRDALPQFETELGWSQGGQSLPVEVKP